MIRDYFLSSWLNIWDSLVLAILLINPYEIIMSFLVYYVTDLFITFQAWADVKLTSPQMARETMYKMSLKHLTLQCVSSR